MAKINFPRRREATMLLDGRTDGTVSISWTGLAFLWTLIESWADEPPVFRWLPGMGRSRYRRLGQVGRI